MRSGVRIIATPSNILPPERSGKHEGASYKDCTTAGLASGRLAPCAVQQILIIDPATGLPMAEELRYLEPPGGQRWTAPDGLFSYEIFGHSYWTNQNPPKPANRPQVNMQPMSR